MSVSLVVRVIISGKGWYDGAGDDEDAGVADGRAVLDGVVGVVPAQVPPALREGKERMKSCPSSLWSAQSLLPFRPKSLSGCILTFPSLTFPLPRGLRRPCGLRGGGAQTQGGTTAAATSCQWTRVSMFAKIKMGTENSKRCHLPEMSAQISKGENNLRGPKYSVNTKDIYQVQILDIGKKMP